MHKFSYNLSAISNNIENLIPDMKSLVLTTIVIILITVFLSTLQSLLQTSWQASELLFYGKSSFKIPDVMYQEEKTKFSINLLYEKGPYTLTELKPVIDVYPESAASHVSIETKPIDIFLNPISSVTIHGIITVDSTIPADQIFLTSYFMAKDTRGTPYKSSWNDSSTPIKIGIVRTTAMKSCDDLAGSNEGKPIDLQYDIEGGSVIQICKYQNSPSVIAKIDATQDGKITITIPRKMVYSLGSLECDQDKPLVLMDGEETSQITIKQNKNDNLMTVGFSKGVHKIEFVGYEILPYPSPSMLCGIVRGFDSQFLPPRFQLENGVPLEGIRCNDKLELLMNPNNGKPICVRSQMIESMINRGWVNHLSCIDGNLVGSENQTFSCFCKQGEDFVKGGHHTRKDSSLEITRQDNVTNENNQKGIAINVFNPELYAQYVSVWSTCK